MNQKELDLILSQHKSWLENDGKQGKQANFSRNYIEGNYPRKLQGSTRVIFYKDGSCKVLGNSILIGRPTKFERENERVSHFTGLDFKKADLTSAIFEDALFHDCNMSSIRVAKCDLTKTKFVHTNLQGSYFGGDFQQDQSIVCMRSKTRGIYFVYCNISNCCMQNFDFTNAVFEGSILRDSSFLGTNFSGAKLNMVKFNNTNLICTKFNNCNLEKSDFTNANLTSADLSYSNVHLADFSDTKADGLVFKMKSLKNRICSAFSLNHVQRNFIGCRIDSSYGNERIKKAIREEAYIEEFAQEHPKLFKLWLLSSDCGRSIKLWILWSSIVINIFALFYLYIGNTGFSFNPNLIPLANSGNYFLYVYYSIVTFTTLGFGDITPITNRAMSVVVSEVIIGFVMLGLLISILANKVASRGQ